MKVKIHRMEFAKLIGRIQNIVAAKPTIPILTNVLIEAANDQLIISATDLIVSMRTYIKAIVDQEGAITLPARRLFQLIRELTTPEIEIEMISPEVAIVHSGSSHFRIQGMHKTEFPVFPDFSDGIVLYFKTETLKEMLNRTAFAAAKDDSRQVLNGVLLEKIGQYTTFIGTDGKRLARNQVKLEKTSEEKGSFVLPLKAVEEIIRILDEQEETAKVVFLGDKIVIEVATITLISKLLSGQYPDVSRVIPKKTSQSIALHRDELVALLRQVALFTSEQSSSVRFSFSEGTLHLSAMSGEIGEGRVSMPVNYSGPKLEIAFNPHYFIDILRHSKDEIVQFDVSDSYNPGLITDSSNAEFVIMPMRLET